jgi:hypothetical protein
MLHPVASEINRKISVIGVSTNSVLAISPRWLAPRAGAAGAAAAAGPGWARGPNGSICCASCAAATPAQTTEDAINAGTRVRRLPMRIPALPLAEMLLA